MDELKYLNLCRLSTENYLQLEQTLFEFVDVIYMYDDWEKKKQISTMPLANLHSSICSGIEETLKLFLINPKNDLITDFVNHIKNLPLNEKHKNDILKELNSKKLENIKLTWILDYKNFREKLNEFSPSIIFSKPPFEINFPDNFSKMNAKPKWYDIYEDIKHNFLSKYSQVNLDIVLAALAAYYLTSRLIAHEAAFIVKTDWQGGYYPWYEASINVDRSLYVGASENDIQHFKSKKFETLSLRKK